MVPLIGQSQSWYPIGATWYFNFQEQLSFPANGFTKYSVVKDTIVDGYTSKLLSKNVIRYNGDTISTGWLIVREENSKAYYYYYNLFKLMYDFSLNIGDTLNLDISGYACDSVSPLIVDSIKYINLNGTNIRIQYLNGIFYYNSSYGGQSDTKTYKIVERVGSDLYGTSLDDNFFFNPVCEVSDQFIWNGLRCYNDSNISYTGNYFSLHYPLAPCDTLIDGSTGINNFSLNENQILLFPNPSSDFINVKGISDIQNIEIYNSYGKLINTFKPKCSNYCVDIKSYLQGVYILIIYENNITPKYFKIIKT